MSRIDEPVPGVPPASGGAAMLLARLANRRGFGLLLLSILVLRLPGMIYGVVDLDEIEFLLIGHSLRLGWLPYVDLVETKPLLAYVFYAPTALFGFSIWPVQLLAVLWTFATARMVGSAARLWTGSDEVGVAAAWLAGLASACNLVSVNAELMMNLPLAVALYFFVQSERRDHRSDRLWADSLCAGIAAGVATLFKHQAGIALVALSLAMALSSLAGRRGTRGPGWTRQTALYAGFIAPWAIAAALYAALGHWDAFYEWNVTRNFSYVGHGAGSVLARFALSLLLCVILGTPLLWYFAVRATLAPGSDAIGRGVALALWLTFIPVSMGGRFYEHYFIQFVPPLALLAAPGAAAVLARWRTVAPIARVAFVLTLVGPPIGFWIFGMARGALHAYIGQDPKILEVGRWLRTETPPDARVFVWGHAAPIYYVAQRLPGTRYKNAVFQTGDFDPQHIARGFDLRPYLSRRDLAATRADFQTRRPDYVVDTAPCDIHSWSKVPLSLFPELVSVLDAQYELVAQPAGCPIYRRKP